MTNEQFEAALLQMCDDTRRNGNDSPATVKIKEFMALYGIIDIKMRMLHIPELKRIMGFSSDYILVGTQADQKKFIGNAVEVNMARVLCEALCARLIEGDIQTTKSGCIG